MVFTMRSASSTLPIKLVLLILELMKTKELLRFRLDTDGPYCTTCVSGSYVIKGISHIITVTLLLKFALSSIGTAGLEGTAHNINCRLVILLI